MSNILTRELNADPGSFIAGMRFDLTWDPAKFAELCRALHGAAKAHAGKESLPRGLSQLFWYCGTFIRIGRREFREGQLRVDYDKACALLRRLGDAWFGDDSLLTDAELDEQLASV